jgi:hypothetical protein
MLQHPLDILRAKGSALRLDDLNASRRKARVHRRLRHQQAKTPGRHRPPSYTARSDLPLDVKIATG